ncbi:MAG: hypothetical protein QNK69_03660 [Amylibacter sp.]
MRVICVNTGDKFDQWYTDNLKHMIDTYSGLQYDSFEVIDEEIYGGVYDKLQMFDLFRDGQNIYFDLDVLIKGDCNQFLRKELTACHAWWREPFHTPLNSSIISWYGDRSRIFEFFDNDWTGMMRTFYRGIDQYLYEVYRPKTFTESFCSFQTITKEADYDVYLFNQRYEYMKTTEWCQKYFLQSQ